MSTLTILLAKEAETPPKLYRFLPRFRGQEGQRRMLTLVPDINTWLSKAVTSQPLIKVKAQTRTHFGQFVKGEPVDDCYFMKRVQDRRRNPPDFNHQVWAISPRFDPPQYRFFGAFVTQDWFLVCTKQARDRLDEHENRWHEEIDKTLRIWKHFFGTELPHGGAQLRDYIRHNARHYDDRW
jgi:hypothetical protein